MRLEEWPRSADNGTSALKSIIHDGVVALCHEWAGKIPFFLHPCIGWRRLGAMALALSTGDTEQTCQQLAA